MNAGGGIQTVAGAAWPHVPEPQGRQRSPDCLSRRPQVATADARLAQGAWHRLGQQDQERPGPEMIYPLHTEPDDNGTILITCPLLPDVTTYAEREADIERVARNAIEEALAARMRDGAPIPLGGTQRKRSPVNYYSISLPLMATLKLV